MGNVIRYPDPVDEIPAEAESAVRSVMAERGIDPELYDVSYYMDDESYSVALAYKHKTPGLRGSHPVHKDYEIVISRDDFSVVRVSISR